jgi:hypothetical protein
MNVEQLRRVLADIPGDMSIIVEDSKMGWMENTALYLAPAHIDHRISGNYLYASHQDGADNCEALLISGFGQSGEGFVEISPQPAWPKVIDIEAEVPRQWGFGDLPAIKAACRRNRPAVQAIHRCDTAVTKSAAERYNQDPDCRG